jgi:FkbM family methyltransferase
MVNQTFKRVLRAVLPAGTYRRLVAWKLDLFDEHARTSFAQEGEDLILFDLLQDVPDGFYVDVGAFHPEHYSNTCLFYRRGWRGINIEPSPDAAGLFRRKRPRDITVQAAVTLRPAPVTLHVCEREPTLNTCDAAVAERRRRENGRVYAEVQVEGLPLAMILERHLPAGQAIHFLSVDVEGLELDVLRSNDWARFRPRYVLTESLDADLPEVLDDEAARFLREHDYVPFARTQRTSFFRDRRLPRVPAIRAH